MHRTMLAAALALTVLSSAVAAPAPTLTLEKIMAEPDWIGSPVVGPYWSADAKAVYYHLKRSASPIRDLHRIDLGSGSDSVVDASAMANADGPPVYDAAGRQAAFVRNGDVFVRDVASGGLRQITRTPGAESEPRFSADGRMLTFRSGHDWFVHDIATGVTAPAAVLKTEKDPDASKPDDLRDLQLRLFTTLKRNHDDKRTLRQHADDMQKADPTRAPLPFYLGDDIKLLDSDVSPDGRWLLVVTAKKTEDGRHGDLMRYVTESGYEEVEKERVRVGRNPPLSQSVQLLDLIAHQAYPLSLD
ncbi:MAG TPA: S9 family peptidase, partial [Rudaea sp.]